MDLFYVIWFITQKTTTKNDTFSKVKYIKVINVSCMDSATYFLSRWLSFLKKDDDMFFIMARSLTYFLISTKKHNCLGVKDYSLWSYFGGVHCVCACLQKNLCNLYFSSWMCRVNLTFFFRTASDAKKDKDMLRKRALMNTTTS